MVDTVFIVFSLVGALIASKQPGNGVGWLFCVFALYISLGVFAWAYEYHALISDPGSLPGGAGRLRGR